MADNASGGGYGSASGEMPAPMLHTLILEVLQQQGAVAQQLGILSSNVAMLLDDRGRASASRARLHEKIDDVTGQIGAINGRVIACEEKIGGMAGHGARLATLETDRDGRRAIAGFVKRLGSGGYAVAGAIGAVLIGIVHQWERIAAAVRELFK